MYDPEEKLDRFLKTVARRNGRTIGATAIFSSGDAVLLINFGDYYELPTLKIDYSENIKSAIGKIAEERFGKEHSIKNYIGSFFVEDGECRCYAFEVGVPSSTPVQHVWVDCKDLENKKIDKETKRLLRKFIRNKEKGKYEFSRDRNEVPLD